MFRYVWGPRAPLLAFVGFVLLGTLMRWRAPAPLNEPASMRCYIALATHVRLTLWKPFNYRLTSLIYAMNIKYFQDTDTLYVEFKTAEVAESKDLDENTVLDLDQSGNILG